MKSSSVVTPIFKVSVVLVCGLLFSPMMDISSAKAAGNCQFTPPLNSMPEEYEKKYRASNPKDCWEKPNGICRKDACAGAGGDAQGLQQFAKLAEQFMKMVQGGGGSGSGTGGTGSTYSGAGETNLNYTQQQALDDLYTDFVNNQGDVDIFDYFTPAGTTTATGTDPSDEGSSTEGQYGKPGAAPQEYFCPDGECASAADPTNGSDTSSEEGEEQDDDDNGQAGTNSATTNTASEQTTPSNVTTPTASQQSSGIIDTVTNAINNGIEYLRPGDTDRIIYDDEETQDIDLTDPRRRNNGQAAQRDTESRPQSGSGVPSAPPPDVDTSQLTDQFNWQRVENQDGFGRLLFQLGLLAEVDGQVEPSYLTWFLVTPVHGVGAGVSGSVRAALSGA